MTHASSWIHCRNKDDPVIPDVKTAPDAQQKTTVAAGSGNSSGSWSWGSFLQKATSDIVGKVSSLTARRYITNKSVEFFFPFILIAI